MRLFSAAFGSALLFSAAAHGHFPNVSPVAVHSFQHHYGQAPLYSAASAGASVLDFEASRKGSDFQQDASNVVEAFISPFLPTGAAGSFEVTSTYQTSHNGVTHVFYQQVIDGIPVMNGVGQINLDANDNVISSSDSFWKGAVPATTPLIKAGKAVQTFVGTLSEEGASEITNDPANDAQQMWVVNGKSLQLAWVFEVDVGDFEHVLSVAIDAASGSTLQCVDLVSDTDVHVHPEDAPASPSQRKLQSAYRGWGIPNLTPELGDSILLQDPQDKVPGANPNGWHKLEGQDAFRDTRGNNVFAQENQANDDSFPPNGYRPSSQSADGLVFDFDMDLEEDPGSEGNVDAVVTNLFLTNNLLHDLLYSYGFDEASGNFQRDNFGRGGGGNDPVVANALDGSGVNNANMYTPGDGSAPRMRMYRWTQRTGEDRPSSLDGLVVAHEYTHGLSTRLTGGPANPVCLQSLISGGMGEGWSDFVGVMMSIGSAADFSDSIAVGSWLVDFGGGIRRYPYSTDFNINPYTFDDVNRESGVHGVGTVWCTMLFDMAADLVQEVGFNEDIYQSPDVAEGGNNVAMQNVIDGMKLQPCNPSFIDARDAILMADMENYGGAHQCTIWRSFARRGLGTLATQALSASESFCVPDECNPDGEPCIETGSPTPAPYEDQDLGVLGVGGGDGDSSGTVFIEGFTTDRDSTYGQPAPDVRITFRLPTAGVSGATLDIDTCSQSTNFDTYLWLLDSDGALVGSNDDTTIGCSFSGLFSHLRFEVGTEVQPGMEYTLVVDGYSSGSGAFGLTLSLQNELMEDPWPVPSPAPPTSRPTPAPPTSPPTLRPTLAPPTSPPTLRPTLAPPTSPPTPRPTLAPPSSPPTHRPTLAPPSSPPTPRPSFPNDDDEEQDDEVEIVCDAVEIINRDFACNLEIINRGPVTEFCGTILELDAEYDCGVSVPSSPTANPTPPPTESPTAPQPGQITRIFRSMEGVVERTFYWSLPSAGGDDYFITSFQICLQFKVGSIVPSPAETCQIFELGDPGTSANGLQRVFLDGGYAMYPMRIVDWENSRDPLVANEEYFMYVRAINNAGSLGPESNTNGGFSTDTLSPTPSPTTAPETAQAVTVQFRASNNGRFTTEAPLYLFLLGEGDLESEPIDLGLVTARTTHVVETTVRAPGIGPLRAVKLCLDESEPDRTRLIRRLFELVFDGTTYTFERQTGTRTLRGGECWSETVVGA